MIYIASPYSGTLAEQARRYEWVREYAHRLIRQGVTAFSPIVYAHEMAVHHNMATDAKGWVQFNTTMIRLSSGVHVLKLPGWDQSIGVAAEMDLARHLFIPLQFVTPSFIDLLDG